MAIQLNQIGSFATGAFDQGAAEIAAFDPTSQRLFVVNGAINGLDVLDLSDPANPIFLETLDVALTGGPNSVAVANGIVAVALENFTSGENGFVGFYSAASLELLKVVEVGVLPDAVTFTPNGMTLLVANEGEPVGEDNLLTVDPEGSISIIDLSAGVAEARVTPVNFSGFNGRENDLRGDGVRIFPGRSVAQDLEPEFIAVTADGTTAYVTLQENNAVAVLDIESATVLDILPLGVTDFSRGLPTLETFDIPDLTTDAFQIGMDTEGNPIFLGGLSALAFDGFNPDNGNPRFLTLNDRGPVGETLSTSDPDSSDRPFFVPDLQVTVLTLELDEASGQVSIIDRLGLTREVLGVPFPVPITGLPNIPGFFEVPVNAATGEPLRNDFFGLDSEGIIRGPNGNLYIAEEQAPSISVFSPDGLLMNRFVPAGFAAQDETGNPPGSFGTETLPSVYLNRRGNRGFEGIAFDDERNILYGFIQTPLSNPDTATSNGSSILRILGIDPSTGVPLEEFVYQLQSPALVTTDPERSFGDAEVDRIGDAVFAGNGQFYVIERDNEDIPTAQQFIFRINLQGATNILGTDIANATDGLTLEQLSPDELIAAGIQPVHKIQVTNLPSLGFSPSPQTEGLALLPDGRLAVINDNDSTGPGTPTQLGLIQFDQRTNGLDPSNQDGRINIANFPLFGFYQPDSIATFEVGGQQYFITANEGDGRDSLADLTDLDRVRDLTLDPNAFPDAATLQLDENLGRLEVSLTDGDLDGDGDFDQLFAFGTRSFSIRDALGNLVFDSGDQLEQITAAAFPDDFNANNDENGSFDNRSDDGGPEPEGVVVGVVGDRTYAFIGLERIGGVVVYDVSDPAHSEFVQYINNRDFSVEAQLPDGTTNPAVGDLGPEGLVFISAEDSPNGSPLLVVANEVSGTTSIFQVDDLNGGDDGDGPTIITIPEIQGVGHISPFLGTSVQTHGILTAIAFNGYYLQDATGDGNNSSADGIFIFGNANGLAVGDDVTVTGTVAEFIPGGAGSGNLSTTQLVADSARVNSSGNPLPEAVIISINGRLPSNTLVISDDELPVNLQNGMDDLANIFDPENDAIDFYESLEGQLVTLEDVVAVSPTRVFSDFSAEAFVLPNRGETSDDLLNNRGGIPLNSGPDNRGDQNPERIQIQFDPTISGEEVPPALTVGDQLGDVTGVLGYSFGNFEVNVTGPVSVVTPGGLEPEVTTLVGTQNHLTFASYNVLNLTSSQAVEGNIPDPDAEQRSRLAQQVVTNLRSPDIIALQEIQDSNGVEGTVNDLVSDATQTLQDLVDAIAAAGGPRYEFVDVFAGADATEFTVEQGGAPSGNIRNAFLYNPDRVTLEGVDALTPTALTAAGVSNPEAFSGSRVPLVGTFSFQGEAVTVVNNHFSSRFGSTPIFGGPQPFVQAGEAEREAQSLALNEYVSTLLATQADANIIVAGDLNTFQFTNDLTEILPGTGDEQILTNLVTQAEEAGEASTFIFDGNSQVLDHTFVTNALLPKAEFDIVHVNNDFPRDDNGIEFPDAIVASDHEPILSRFDFSPEIAPLPAPPEATGEIELSQISTLATAEGAEIVGFDSLTQRLFVTGGDTVEVLDLRDPNHPTSLQVLDFSETSFFNRPGFVVGGVNSLAITNAFSPESISSIGIRSILAVALENDDGLANGQIAFINADTLAVIGTQEAGILPDAVTFTPDGTRLIVANEAEGDDAEGSISVIDLMVDASGFSTTATQLDFTAFNGQEDVLRSEGVRIAAGLSASQDLEPEFSAVSADGTTAYVTLQENNAIAIVDLSTNTPSITDIVALGVQDFSLPGHELDPSDRDGADGAGAINLRNVPVFGFFQPDAIDTFQIGGETFIITANEGDGRDNEIIRLGNEGSVPLDPTVFPNAQDLIQDSVLGRLEVSGVDGDIDGDGDIDQIFAFGGRSFSIRNAAGTLIFDSGNQIAAITADQAPLFFNANNGDSRDFDQRSDDAGAEPEGVVVGEVKGVPFAFIAPERGPGGILVYNLSNPASPEFVQYLVPPDANGDGVLDDVAPEGLTFISAADSPNGIPLLAVAYEETSTTTIYQISAAIDPNAPSENSLVLGTTGDDLIFPVQDARFDGIGDTVFTGAGRDEVDIALSTREDLGGNRVNTGSGDDIISVSRGDRVSGSIGNDLFDAEFSLGNNRLSGGEGNDTFILGGEGDRVLGGAGNDTIEILFSASQTVIAGGDGIDNFFFLPNGEVPADDLNNQILDFEIGTDRISFGIGIEGSDIGIDTAGDNTTLSIFGSHVATFLGVLPSELLAEVSKTDNIHQT